MQDPSRLNINDMAEETLLKFAQPALVLVGLMVVLNLWSIVNFYLQARRERDSSTEDSFKKLNEFAIKADFRMEQFQKDLNNIGQMVKDLRNKK